MNYAFTFFPSQCFRDLLVQDDLPVVVREDDIVNFCFGGFSFPVNSARAMRFQGLLGDSCCNSVWGIEEMTLVTLTSLSCGSGKDTVFESAVRI